MNKSRKDKGTLKTNKEKRGHYDIDIAEKYGFVEAIAYEEVVSWLRFNKEKKKNIKMHSDGKFYYWTYFSTQSLADKRKFVSRSTISRAFTNIEKHGLITSSSIYNRRTSDNTKWYTTPDFSLSVNELKEFTTSFLEEKGKKNSDNLMELLSRELSVPLCTLHRVLCRLHNEAVHTAQALPEVDNRGLNTTMNSSIATSLLIEKKDSDFTLEKITKNSMKNKKPESKSKEGAAPVSPRKSKSVKGAIKSTKPKVVSPKVTKTKRASWESKLTLEERKQITEIITIFYDAGNKLINFGDIFLRQAAWKMIKTQGFEEVVEVAKIAIGVYGQDYAPTITNPKQLLEKWMNLSDFVKRNEPAQITGGIVNRYKPK